MYGIFRVRTFALTTWNTRQLYFNVAYCHVMYTTRCTPFGHTFQKKIDVTKSWTILDIVFSSVEIFFVFQMMWYILFVWGYSPRRVALEYAQNIPATGNQACCNTLKCYARLTRFPTSHNPVKRIFQTCSVEVFDSTEPKKIRQISLWT